jgi:hypothetical protein
MLRQDEELALHVPAALRNGGLEQLQFHLLVSRPDVLAIPPVCRMDDLHCLAPQVVVTVRRYGDTGPA